MQNLKPTLIYDLRYTSNFLTAVLYPCYYHLLQLFFGIVLFNGDLTISFESFVELVSDVPFHAVCCTNITDTADMSPSRKIPKCLTIHLGENPRDCF